MWGKVNLLLPDGQEVPALTPTIISASRASDIPAFHSRWLVQRINEGYVPWRNPFNGKVDIVSFSKTRLVVFWSKNPAPLMPYLDFFDTTIKNYYFQFTLNDYENEKFEPHVPPLEERIETFMRLSLKIGKEKVIWRFDPLIMTNKLGVPELLRKVENIGNQVKGFTEKLVFSFADIGQYKRVSGNFRRNNIPWRDFQPHDQMEFARGLQQLNKSWNLEMATCAEDIELSQFAIHPNKCIDDNLIVRLFSHDTPLMIFLGKTISPSFPADSIYRGSLKDKGQRRFCGCIKSKDIGQYNTCAHGCIYCYANRNKTVVKGN